MSIRIRKKLFENQESKSIDAAKNFLIDKGIFNS